VITAAAARLQIPGLTGTAEDTKIETLIDVADAMIAAAVCAAMPDNGAPTLASATYTLIEPEVVVSEDGYTLLVRVPNITAVTSLHVSASRVWDASTLRDSAGYVLDVRTSMIEIDPSYPPLPLTRRSVRAVVTAGWATLPDDLAHAVAVLTRHLFDLRHGQGRTSVSEAGISTSLRPETMPDAVRQMIARYVVPVV
jgi:hypothetical protein